LGPPRNLTLRGKVREFGSVWTFETTIVTASLGLLSGFEGG